MTSSSLRANFGSIPRQCGTADTTPHEAPYHQTAPVDPTAPRHQSPTVEQTVRADGRVWRATEGALLTAVDVRRAAQWGVLRLALPVVSSPISQSREGKECVAFRQLTTSTELRPPMALEIISGFSGSSRHSPSTT